MSERTLKPKSQPRRASSGQTAAMEKILSGLPPDADGTAALKAGCEESPPSGQPLPGDMPDEERDAIRKVDFSVLQHELPAVTIYPDEMLGKMDAEHLVPYARTLGKALEAYREEYLLAATQLANAQELVLNGQNALFGRSSQRFSAITGKQHGKEDAAAGKPGEGKPGTDGEPDAGKRKATGDAAAGQGEPASDGTQGNPPGPGTGKGVPKGRPRRQKGCADRVCQDAEENIIHVRKSAEELDRIFGKGNWEDVEGLRRSVKSYRVVPARIVVDVLILHQYRAKDPGACRNAPEVVGARNPMERLRPKSRVSSSLMAYLLYMRGNLRMPVDRVCSHVAALGLNLTPQQVYENLDYYDQFFTILQERQWTKLLLCHYLQIDETPVRYYDSKAKKVKRGYMWVFTASEMLDDAEKISLFYFAEGRGADVLRECLSGFTGVVGSDGHSAYQVFARESDGKVVNAGCLEHFRKRLVAALRAVPGLAQMTEEEKKEIPAFVILERLNKVFALERKVKLLQTKAEREAFRESQVREAFEAVVEETLGLKDSGQPAGSYLASAIRYMENQEVYLEEFLKDGNIACQNSKSEQKIAFFAVLRGQVKMFGSFRGAQVAGTLEGLEQTARQHVKDTRIYYQFLLDRLVPYIRKKRLMKEHPEDTIDWAHDEALDAFTARSKEYLQYEMELKKQERAAQTVSAGG